MADGMTNDDRLSKLVHWFEHSEESCRDARSKAEEYRDYYDGYQWTSEEESTLRARNQPPVVDNRIADKVNYLLGLERSMRTDPKAYPRTPQDEGSSEAATDALRFVMDNNNFDQTRSACSKNYMIEGTMAAEVIVEKTKKGEPQIRINYIFWDRFFHDPYSRREDFADARYMGQAIWMDYEQAKKKYEGKDQILENSKNSLSPIDETYEDKPSLWWDEKRKRVRVLEIYYKEGVECYRGVFCKGGFLEEPELSAYKDEDGVTVWPYEAQSAFVDREGNRYGMVRRYKDLQDELNKRRSKFLDAISRRNVVMDKGAVDDVTDLKLKLHRPDGIIEKKRGFDFQVLPNTDIASGNFQLLQQTMMEFGQVGPNAVLSGTGGSESGRSKQIDQQGAVLQLGSIFDGIRAWQKRIYRKSWNCIRDYWDEPKWIRVRDLEQDQGFRFVGLNVYDQQAGQVVNKVATMDVDIIVDEAPDVITLQQETFNMLMLLAKSGMPIPPKMLIEMSPLPASKKRTALAYLEPPPEAQQQQQIGQQLAMAEKMADIENTRADAAKKQATADKQRAETEEQEIENYFRGLGIPLE